MELEDLNGIGKTRLASLRAMGITSLRDLLYTLPVRYEDRTTPQPCATAGEGPVLVSGVVREKPKIAYFKGMSRVTAVIQDASGALPLCWFNQPWMMLQLPLNAPVLLYGRLVTRKGYRTLQNPKVIHELTLTPVYRVARGIPGESYRKWVLQALAQVSELCPETLSDAFRHRYALCALDEALRQSHQPDSVDSLRMARRRMAFEQMLMYLTCVAMDRDHLQPGFPFQGERSDPDSFWDTLPFPPTGAQRRVLSEIRDDLCRPYAMARLVQGDVGCGKTAIAFGAIHMAWRNGYQSAMMAPTEILAEQHYEYALRQFEPLGMRVRLLTGSTKARERRQILSELASGQCHAVFGTQALISEGVVYARLGLVITDEQHRFGVRQRTSLQRKGELAGREAPHVLVMSATPIPRTLALILYGDLSLSVVDELPPGRQPVKTRLVPEEKRNDLYEFVRKQVSQGQQAYVVCPLVESSEDAGEEVRSAREVFEELQGAFSHLRVGLTWGAQKSEEKTSVLRAFKEGQLDVLVSTTVIEVGVNVPAATVMIIENAERYGLSQLHQLRGRVGRGSQESWCFLLSKSNSKLKVLCETNDGFVVAQKDLELRGPGDLMGTRQSGESLHGILLDGDTRMLEEVSACVRDLYHDPALHGDRLNIEALATQFALEQHLSIARN